MHTVIHQAVSTSVDCCRQAVANNTADAKAQKFTAVGKRQIHNHKCMSFYMGLPVLRSKPRTCQVVLEIPTGL